MSPYRARRTRRSDWARWQSGHCRSHHTSRAVLAGPTARGFVHGAQSLSPENGIRPRDVPEPQPGHGSDRPNGDRMEKCSPRRLRRALRRGPAVAFLTAWRAPLRRRDADRGFLVAAGRAGDVRAGRSRWQDRQGVRHLGDRLGAQAHGVGRVRGAGLRRSALRHRPRGRWQGLGGRPRPQGAPRGCPCRAVPRHGTRRRSAVPDPGRLRREEAGIPGQEARCLRRRGETSPTSRPSSRSTASESRSPGATAARASSSTAPPPRRPVTGCRG